MKPELLGSTALLLYLVPRRYIPIQKGEGVVEVGVEASSLPDRIRSPEILRLVKGRKRPRISNQSKISVDQHIGKQV